MVTVGFPLLWGVASTFRGLITAVRKTRNLLFSAGVRLAAVLLAGSIVLFDPEANGALVGVLALMGAFGMEGIILGWALFSPGGASKHFPAAETEAELEERA